MRKIPRRLSSLRSVMASLATALLLSLGALATSSCATLVSEQQEIALGQQYRQQLEQEKDIRNSAYLSSLGNDLAAYAPARPNINYQFSVVVDPELNAFAIPGGHIYIHSGTIDAVDNAAELAGVLAHEISHVALEHHRESMGRAMGIDLLNQLALEDQSQALQTGVMLVEQGVMQKFSRTQEYAADDMAIEILYRAGYNPEGLATFFEKLVSAYGGGSKFFEFMSSHPVTGDRIARAREIISQLPSKPGLITNTAAFETFARQY